MSYLDGFLNKQDEKSGETTSQEEMKKPVSSSPASPEALSAAREDRSVSGQAIEEQQNSGPERNLLDTAAETPTAHKGPALDEAAKKALQSAIIDVLCEIYDPEIPVDIYQMGLIYDVVVGDYADVEIVMTLTTPHCPVAETMPGEVEMKVQDVAGVGSVRVELVWEPPWDISMMSEAARLEMGFM